MIIGIWGDSITYGEGDIDGLGWAGRLRKTSFSDKDLEVYNRGICGDTTEGLIKRFRVEADSINPDLIIFAIGINDSCFRDVETKNLVPLAIFGENVGKLVAEAKLYTQRIFIVGTTSVDETLVNPLPDSTTGKCYRNDVIKKYRDILEKLSNERSCTFIDVSELLNVKMDLIDGLHPNSGGYEKLYKTISTQLTL